jgi:hypothetical protein
MTMNKLVKVGSQVLAFTALLALGSVEARAQEWPTTLQLRCDWTRTNTGAPTFGGKAKVTMTYTYTDPYLRRGTLRTEYPDGSVNLANFDLYWDWPSGYYNRFNLVTSTGVTCNIIKTFEAGTIVSYDACFGSGFQSFQYCRP